MAFGALAITKDCADAYVLLAEEAAATAEEALQLYRRGVLAGRRAIGKDLFDGGVGRFWEIPRTRPYMRARAGLAKRLWEAGEREEAMDHCREMLQLNPGDDQRIRWILEAWLLHEGRDREAWDLLERYPDSISAEWTYARALLTFRREGDTETSRTTLAEAVRRNPHVPAYLLGERRMPSRLPDVIQYGRPSEAVAYVHGSDVPWRETAGALDWIRRSLR
jgi:tetratricopeptide (TPR) repeat protein